MAVVVIKQSVINRVEQVYIFGGKNESEGRDREFLNESIREPNYLNEVWSWSGNRDQGWIKVMQCSSASFDPRLTPIPCLSGLCRQCERYLVQRRY